MLVWSECACFSEVSVCNRPLGVFLLLSKCMAQVSALPQAEAVGDASALSLSRLSLRPHRPAHSLTPESVQIPQVTFFEESGGWKEVVQHISSHTGDI